MLNLLFGLNGRIKRTQWWLVSLGIFGLGQGLSWYLRGYMGPDGKPTDALTQHMGIVLPVLTVGGFLALMSVWVQFAVDVKRFQDRGKSFWWPLAMRAPVILLILLVVSFIGSMAAQKPDSNSLGVLGALGGYGVAAIGCMVLTAIGAIWVIIECGFCSGDIDDNQYGPGDGMNIADDIMALSGGRPAVATSEVTTYRSGPVGFINMPAATPRPQLQSNGKPVFGRRG